MYCDDTLSKKKKGQVSIEFGGTFKVLKLCLNQSYDNLNPTLMVISYEIYETCFMKLVSLISTVHVRSSLNSMVQQT